MSDRDVLARELFIAENYMQPREQSIVDWEWFTETPRFAVRIERYTDTADRLIAAGIGDMADAWDDGYGSGHADGYGVAEYDATNPYRSTK